MAFVYDRNNDTGGMTQVYDVDRDLEFAQGPGAYGESRSYFRSYKNPDILRGGGIKWHSNSRYLTDEEKEIYPDYVKGITICTIERFDSLVTVGLIKGCDLAETVEIIREAMMVEETAGFENPKAPFICEVVFGSDFDLNLNKGDK